MNESGALLNLAASDLVQASRGSPNELAVSSQKYSKSFENLMNPGMQLAGQTTVSCLKFCTREPWKLFSSTSRGVFSHLITSITALLHYTCTYPNNVLITFLTAFVLTLHCQLSPWQEGLGSGRKPRTISTRFSHMSLQGFGPMPY